MDFLERQCWAKPVQILALALAPAVHIPGAGGWVLGALVVAAGWLSWRRRGSGLRVAVVFGVAALLVGVWMVRSGPPQAPAWPFLVVGSASGEGTVVAEAPVSRRGMTFFRFRIDEVRLEDWAGRANAVVTVLGYRGPSPSTGSRWTWTGKIGDGTLIWTSGTLSGWVAPWWELRGAARQALSRVLQPLGPGPAGLAEALLIGAVDDLTPWEKDSFRMAGCSHILALSGMHLSLLAVILMGVLSRRGPPLLIFCLIQLVLGLFCFLAGAIPSLWRAWVMAALAGWWGLTKRPVPPTELLAQSYVVVVLLWPEMASTLSLQLSFLAMAGLFFWGHRWERGLRPWVGRWMAVELGTSAAAMLATVPLVVGLFGEVRWIGLIMTTPLVFLTTLVIYAAVAVVVVAVLVPGFDPGFLALPFQGLYDAIFTCTGWAAGFPAFDFGTTVTLGVCGGLGVGAIFLYNKRHRRASLPVALNYDSPASLQAFLTDRGYNALKRWGQNFLINSGARKQILGALELNPGEPVWEIGPGLGALTHHLVEAGHPLTVFEIDPGYVGFLRSEFGESVAGFQVVEGDVVKTWKTLPRSGTKTVGNLPYNAASAIIADFIEGGFFPEVFVVTVQMEMAQRITAVPGTKNHSSFSVLCQSVFRVDEIVTLKPGSFYPAPEVTSRVVRLRPHGRYPGLDHRRFSTFVRECFSSRRKTLRNNLPGVASALNLADPVVVAAFAAAGIDLGLRAETLAVHQFVEVFGHLGFPPRS